MTVRPWRRQKKIRKRRGKTMKLFVQFNGLTEFLPTLYIYTEFIEKIIIETSEAENFIRNDVKKLWFTINIKV